MPRVSPKWAKILARIPGYDAVATAAAGTVFDAEAAERACGFFSTCLVHVKGPVAGSCFALEPWQQAILGNLFGWKRPDGTRRYRTVFLFVPRKNGKSHIAAGVALYLTVCDGEAGAEVYVIAGDYEQAGCCFEPAKQMVLRDSMLSKHCKVYEKAIEVPATGSVLKPLTTHADTKHGMNVAGLIDDELHIQPDPELIDVMTSGMGARKQPVTFHTTTAPAGRQGRCWQEYSYACGVRDGLIRDPSYLPVIYEAPADADWHDRQVWSVANPNLGVSITEEFLIAEHAKAVAMPSYENTFRRLYLNQFTEQDVRWINLDRWRACRQDYGLDAFAGRICYLGLDLATTRDIAAMALIGQPRIGSHERELDSKCLCWPWFFVPEKTAEDRSRRDKLAYLEWVARGHLIQTPGDVIDYSRILAEVLSALERFDVRQVGLDPWNATHLAQRLQEEFQQVVFVRQGFASLNEPSKRLERLILAGELAHPGQPVLDWMIGNVATESDSAGNIKPSKKVSREKIDGVVALVIALACSIAPGAAASDSVYESRGLLTL